MEGASLGGASVIAIPVAAGSLALIADGTIKVGTGVVLFKKKSNDKYYDHNLDKQHNYKKPKSNISGKEGAKNVPSWAKGNKPYKQESGKDFAKRLMDEKYGKIAHEKGPESEFNRIKKWGDRAFE